MGNVRARDLFATATHVYVMSGSSERRIEMVKSVVRELLEVEVA